MATSCAGGAAARACRMPARSGRSPTAARSAAETAAARQAGTAPGGAGGAGIANSGTIVTLTNSGTINGGKGGIGPTNGAPGDAIYSAGKHASIGPITNSGKIIGNVEIDNQAIVTVHGGTGNNLRQLDGRRDYGKRLQLATAT